MQNYQLDGPYTWPWIFSLFCSNLCGLEFFYSAILIFQAVLAVKQAVQTEDSISPIITVGSFH